MRLKDAVTYCIALCLGFLQVAGQTPSFTVNGSAINHGNGLIRLTASTPGTSTSGTAWNNTPHDLNTPFDIEYDMFFGCESGPNGGDGITFQFHNSPAGLNALGGGGGFLGMVSPSIGVEFDTWQYIPGGDLVQDHITIIQDGDPNSPYLAGPVAVAGGRDLEDCAQNANDYYTVRITWDPGTQLFAVYENGSLALFYIGDIINNIFGGNPIVYWGFTAATGGASNEQWVAPTGTVIPWECATNSCCGSVPVSVMGPTSICAGDTAIIKLTSTYNDYSWSNGSIVDSAKFYIPGTYTIDVLQDQFGVLCPGTTTFTINESGANATILGDTALCDDGTSFAQLTVEITGGTGPFDLIYAKDGIDQTPVTGISPPYTFASDPGPGTYTISSIVDASACQAFAGGSAEITIHPEVPVGMDQYFCPTGSVLLSVVDDGGTYDWYAAPTGGSSMFTGPDFMTPSLGASTTYYVENTAILDTIRKSVGYLDNTEGTGNNVWRGEAYDAIFADNWTQFTANESFIIETIDVEVREFGACLNVQLQLTDLTVPSTDLVTHPVTCLGNGYNIYTVPVNFNIVAGHDYELGFHSNGAHVPIIYWGLVPSYPIADDPEITFTGSGRGANAWMAMFNWQIKYPYLGSSCSRTPVQAIENCPLAVEEIHLTGYTAAQGHNQLEWKSGALPPGEYFEVLQSNDGSGFVKISEVTLGSFPDDPETFSYSDLTPNGADKNYYKIGRVTTSGNHLFSNTIYLNAGITEPQVYYYDSQIHVYNPDNAQLRMSIFSIDGKEIHSAAVQGKGQHKYEVNELSAGLYIVRLYHAQFSKSVKFQHL